jgi:hypothetical protein
VTDFATDASRGRPYYFEGKPLATRGKQFSSRMPIFKSTDREISRECELLFSYCINLKPMNRIATITLLSIALLLTPAFAQTPSSKETEELNSLLKELQTQQIKIAENQAKIDEKLATLADTVREARLFSSRGGR